MAKQADAVQPLLKKDTWKKDFKRNKILYLLLVPGTLYFILFHYLPIFGIVMAFENFKVSKGFFGSEWVGLKNFVDLFTGEAYLQVMRNTACMALINLVVGTITPIALALVLSEVKWKPFKRTIQTISYMPFFVAAVVVCQLAREFLGLDGGLTQVLTLFGFEQQNWLANPNIPVFWLINCLIGTWQGLGYSAIIFIAAISNVSGDLHEAAAIDGANRWRRMTKITLPSILPLIVMLFTLSVGTVFLVGFDKVLLLYMPTTYSTADCLSTYTFRMAFGTKANYGLSAASGLFQSVLGTTLLLGSNYLNKRTAKMSLF